MVMAIKYTPEEITTIAPLVKIKVIGVGGGGCNAVKRMYESIQESEENNRKDEKIHEYRPKGDVELIVANTDLQVLKTNPVSHKLQLGTRLTKGMGAGARPEMGRKAAEEDKEAIKAAINGADILFIAAGMGGGTGTGATPVIADIAQQMGILTLAIVTRPFNFEGPKRLENAELGIQELKNHVNCLVVIPNDKINSLFEEDLPMFQAFGHVDDVLKKGVLNIAKILYEEGYINTDLEDFRTVMNLKGTAVLGFAEASGDKRAINAIENAVTSPLLENVNIQTAKGMLVSIIADMKTVTQKEYESIGTFIKEKVSNPNIDIKLGVIDDPSLGQSLQVTLLATGIEDNHSYSSQGSDEDIFLPKGSSFSSSSSFQANNSNAAGFASVGSDAFSFSAQRDDDPFDIPPAGSYNNQDNKKGNGLTGFLFRRKAKK